MDRAQGRRALGERGWLAAVPPEFSRALLDICQWRRLEDGQSLYVAGDPPGGIFGIASGALLMSSALAAPGSPPNRLGTAGEWSGFGPLMAQEPRRATMVATGPSLVGMAALPAIMSLLGEHPHWWRHFGHGLLLEFDTVSGIAIDLQLRGSAQRCAAILLHCAGCRYGTPSLPTAAAVWTSQQNVAALANMSRSTLAKVLARFVDSGLVEVEYRSIRLLDVPRLRQLIETS
jgi:CRP-like cAMP-binding protein